MFKKAIATAAIALVAVFAAPLAAYAAYVPEGNITVAGETVPGGTVTVSFSDGSFNPGEPISSSISGEPTPSLGALGVHAGTITTEGTATSGGAVSFSFVIPSNGAGTYTLTATGLDSGNVGSASVSVTPGDSGPDGLVNTGSTLPAMLIWGAVGALLLGTASLAVLTVSRRKKVDA